MTTIIFDTLDFSKRAEKAGFTKDQAEFQAKEAANAIETKIASKIDISDLRKDIKDLELRMTIKLGAMQIVSIGILFTLLKFHA